MSLLTESQMDFLIKKSDEPIKSQQSSENVALPAKTVILLQSNIMFKNALSLLAFILVDLPFLK